MLQILVPPSTSTGQKIITVDSSKINVEDAMSGLRDVIEKKVNAFGFLNL